MFEGRDYIGSPSLPGDYNQLLTQNRIKYIKYIKCGLMVEYLVTQQKLRCKCRAQGCGRAGISRRCAAHTAGLCVLVLE